MGIVVRRATITGIRGNLVMTILRLKKPPLPRWGSLVIALSLAACGEEATTVTFEGDGTAGCDIPAGEIFSAGPGRDGIPALTNPIMVVPGDPAADYLLPNDRVIGLRVGNEVLAIPLNVMWWHEIVNIEVGGRVLAVTHCPLTGSSLAFDREPLGGVEFGVSGLLFHNNLLMYDRTGDISTESLWPQLIRGARCGDSRGVELTMYPIVETTWEWWSENNPNTLVVSKFQGNRRDYTDYPYGDYDDPENNDLLFAVDIDPRRAPKERVFGIALGDRGVAFPFRELEAAGGGVGLVRLDEVGDGVAAPPGTLVFWDREAQGAGAYVPVVDGQELTITIERGKFVDAETGSVWRLDGIATSGPLAGSQLQAIPEAYVAFWFAWADFETNAILWSAP